MVRETSGGRALEEGGENVLAPVWWTRLRETSGAHNLIRQDSHGCIVISLKSQFTRYLNMISVQLNLDCCRSSL